MAISFLCVYVLFDPVGLDISVENDDDDDDFVNIRAYHTRRHNLLDWEILIPQLVFTLQYTGVKFAYIVYACDYTSWYTLDELLSLVTANIDTEKKKVEMRES